MIVTVTLNPSLDRTVDVDRLERGEVQRATATHIHPGGKGVNVTRALLANGVASIAVLPVGGAEGARMRSLLDDEGVTHAAIDVAGETRSNVTVAEADGTTTKLNAAGEPLSARELDLLAQRVVEVSDPGHWVVLCGSLPPGVAADYYATATARLHEAGMKVAIDTSGPALSAALAGRPDLLKPNAAELAEVVGRALPTLGDVVEAAHEVRARFGVDTLVVSLGSAGAMLVDAEGLLVGRSRAVRPRSSVGAGDSFLAGFLAALSAGGDRRDALHRALAFGAAAVQLPGSQAPTSADIDLSAAALLEADEIPAALSTESD